MKSPANCLCLVAPWLLIAAGGCVPGPQRTPTEIRKDSDVVITAGTPAANKADAESAPATAPASGTAAPPAAETAAVSSPAATASVPASNVSTGGSGPARFTGTVRVKGTAPVLAPLVTQGQAGIKDAVCTEQAIPNQTVEVGADGGLKNVFIYLRKVPKGAKSDTASAHPELDQQHCSYVPHAQIMQTGSPIRLKNSDPVAHNVRISGRAASFNQTIPGGNKEGLEFTFGTAETLPAKVSCDFHGWMSAWILPVDHSWAALTDAQGAFSIPDLPDGDLEFVVWHEAAGYIDRGFKVASKPGVVVEQVFEVDASKLAR